MIRSKRTSVAVALGLSALVAIGIGAGIVRLMYGLGTTTSLSDSHPWGLWIIYDVFFVPFSAGAFMILAVAHLYNRKEYHTIARPVVLAGFLGELMVVAVLVMDLGRWNQFYNVLFPWYWNVNSFMFQVSICLTVYMGIMVLEIAPVALERFGWHKPLRVIRALTIAIAGLGIVLSSLHQSSLGSLFLLMPYKLHPMWWTPLLPLLFFASSAFGGLAMAILVAIASFRAFHRPLKLELLADLARVAAVIMGLYLILRLADLALQHELGLLFSSGRLSVLLAVELLVGVAAPLALFGVRRWRERRSGLAWGAALTLAGVALNRTNVALLAQSAAGDATYVPHWMEIVISLAAVAAGILLFALAVRVLPILPGDEPSRPRPLVPARYRRAAMLAGSALVVLTALVVLGLRPVVRAETLGAEPTPTAAMPAHLPADACQSCHLDADALIEAGVDSSELIRLHIQPQAASEPHGNIGCITCHHGNGSREDIETIHAEVIADPSSGDIGLCLACHPDLPEEFPQDRLRTPHDQVAHGEAAGVTCSDCHGGVGHGFDPISGEVICPMAVCLACHVERELDSELAGCDACHIPAHQPVPSLLCSACHPSTETWAALQKGDHPVELVGRHGEASCFACHLDAATQGGDECSACHQAPGETHYGADCAACHTPTSFAEARLPAQEHPVALTGAHAEAACAGCHVPDGPSPVTACSTCHAPPEGHLQGECSVCHTPDGWQESASTLVQRAPRIPHASDARETCLPCHEPGGTIQPAPGNHTSYTDEQCALCHRVGP